MTAPPSGPADLTGQTALVTGAAGGMGTEICSALTRQGADVVATDVDDDGLDDLAGTVDPNGQEVELIQCDVTDRASVQAVRDAALERFGSVEVLVLAHGINPGVAFSEITSEEWNRIIDVNLTGTFLVTRAFLDRFIENGYGKMVALGSITGLTGKSGQYPAYVASKGGIHAFMMGVAGYGAEHGVYANVIAPSLVRTPLTEGAREFSTDYTPLGRVGEPVDIAEAVVFLGSPMSNWITGQVFVLDGGRSLLP